jgi:hypothetical protein
MGVEAPKMDWLETRVIHRPPASRRFRIDAFEIGREPDIVLIVTASMPAPVESVEVV